MDTATGIPTASARRSKPGRGHWLACAALLLAAPVAFFQAAANAGAGLPQWARAWNGFALAGDARARLHGDPQNPAAGLTLGPGAVTLARAAYAREPLASDALFVLALAQAPLRENYTAGPIARQAAALDKRNPRLQLLMIADAVGRDDLAALFDHADLLAAAHPDLAGAVLAPLFDRLGDAAAVPVLAAALARKPHWAAAFERHVPRQPAALRNYLALRLQAGAGARWEGDRALVINLTRAQMYREAFALWRMLAGSTADSFGFSAGPDFAPIGWQPVESGPRGARIGQDGSLFVWLEPGVGGELARRLLELPPGRYRLETRIAAAEADLPLTVTVRCAMAPAPAIRQTFGARTEFAVPDTACPAYWLVISGSALDSRHGVEATLGGWRFSRIS